MVTELRVVFEDAASGVVLRKGIVESGCFSRHIIKRLEFPFYVQAMGHPRITKDNPFLDGLNLPHLDEHGLVRVGTIARVGLAAVSAITPVKERPKDELLGAIFGPAEGRSACDGTFYFEANVAGFEVTEVTRTNIWDSHSGKAKRFEAGMTERVTIVLERTDPAEIGDLLSVAGQLLTIVAITDDGAMPRDEKGNPVDAVAPFLQTLEGHSGDAPSVSAERVNSSAGDDVHFRNVGAYSLISLMPLSRGGQPAQSITADHIAWLLANGFPTLASEFASLKSDDLVNRGALRQLAQGEIPLPLQESIGAPESLFLLVDELRILGLAVDFEKRDQFVALKLAPASFEWLSAAAPAAIRKPETINYRTYLPEKGGLFCETAFGPETHMRRRRAARIELNEPIVPIFYRMGTEPLLSRILKLSSGEIESIIEGRLGLDHERRLVAADNSHCVVKGPPAIGQLLAQQPPYGRLDPASLMARGVYVSPPDMRPLVLLDSGNFATSDLNDHYRRLINRNNRLSKLRELKAPPIILENEMTELQLEVDRLQANGQTGKPVLGDANRPLKACVDLLLPKLCGEDPKRVDWSGAARIVVESRVSDQECQLPATLFEGLGCSSQRPVLLAGWSAFAACTPIRSSESVIRLSNRMAARLRLSSGSICAVHQPLTNQAIVEAKQLQAREPAVEAQFVTPLDLTSQIDLLIEHVVSGEPLVMDTPALFLVGGGGSLRRLADEENPTPQRDVRKLKWPSNPPPTLERLREVADSFALPSRLLSFSPLGPAEQEPAPQVGRVGGRPWLPAGAVWPQYKGKHVPFLGQFPLSPEDNESLPFDVEREMLLTIFWGEDWWESKPTAAPCLLLHGLDGLRLTDSPRDAPAGPLLRIEAERKLQLPQWDELQSMLLPYFDPLPRNLLSELRRECEQDERLAQEGSRIGGYAGWIQGSGDHFVMQFCATEEIDWSFGDAGSLFVVGASPDQLAAIVESH